MRGWLVFHGVYIDLVALVVVPLFVPAVAERLPFPNLQLMFGAAGEDGDPLAVDSFAARQICFSFFFHGIVRAAAGIAPDAPVAWLAACSYFVESCMFAFEHVKGTATDPGALVICPLLAYFCATSLSRDDGEAKKSA